MHCGVLMRIELTGHLDVNIRWLVEFGVQDDGFPVLSENKSHTCNAIYGYPGGPDRAANLEMPVTSYPGGWTMKRKLETSWESRAPLSCSWSGVDGALSNKEKHMQGTSVKYIMWRIAGNGGR